MPFGGLLTVGIIGAAGSLGSSAIGAHAAGSAGKALNAAGIHVGQSIDKATQQAIDAGYAGMSGATNAVRTGLTDASSAVAGNYGAANTALGQAYADQMGQLAPWLQAGQQGLSQLQAFMAPGGAGSKRFDASMMYDDPGYQFRLNQGTKNMMQTAAARGGLQGGGFAKALSRYSQDYASNEYQNAFNRFMSGNAQQYNMLAGLAGFGQNATAQAVNAAGNLGRGISGNFANVGNLLGQMNYGAGNALANIQMQGSQYVGNTGLQGAEAAGNAYMGGALQQAQGNLAAANAWGQGIGNTANLAGGLIYNNYLNNQNQVGGQAGNPYGADPTAGMWQLPQAPQVTYTPPPVGQQPSVATRSWNPYEGLPG